MEFKIFNYGESSINTTSSGPVYYMRHNVILTYEARDEPFALRLYSGNACTVSVIVTQYSHVASS